MLSKCQDHAQTSLRVVKLLTALRKRPDVALRADRAAQRGQGADLRGALCPKAWEIAYNQQFGVEIEPDHPRFLTKWVVCCLFPSPRTCERLTKKHSWHFEFWKSRRKSRNAKAIWACLTAIQTPLAAIRGSLQRLPAAI